MTDVATDLTPEPNALAPQAEPQTAPETATPEQAQEEAQHGNKGKTPWYMDRIAQNQRKADEARAAAEAAETRARAAEEMLERMQRSQQTPPQTSTEPRRPAQQPSEAEFQQHVDIAAQRQRFAEDVNAVRNAGLRNFQDFSQSIEILGSVGIGAPDVLHNLIAVDRDNAHTILDQLAKDPERAATLAEMDPVRRIAEFTRMSDALKTKTPSKEPAAPTAPAAPATKVSKAPAPAPRIEPTSTKTVDWRSDAASDDDFDKGFKEMMEKRRARR